MNDELSILHIGNDNGIYHCSNNITSNNITVINSDCIGESSNNVNTSFSGRNKILRMEISINSKYLLKQNSHSLFSV